MPCLLAAACAGSSGAPPPSGRAAARAAGAGCGAPSVIAHRGETGDGRALPENSARAELAAAAEGATYLNLDVRWTGDAVPVALHDPTVDRTTSERAPRTDITSLTAAQYTALEQRAYAGDTGQGSIVAGAHPQRLAQVLAAVARTGTPVIVQMEADPFQRERRMGSPPTTGTTAEPPGPDSPAAQFAALAKVLRDSSAQVIVAGWTLPDLAAFHAVDPGVVLAYLFETIGASAYPTAAQLKAAGTRILYLDYRGVTPARVAAWHGQGLRVWVWTPSSRAQWERIRADGVDAIATDRAQDYLAWAGLARPCGAQY